MYVEKTKAADLRLCFCQGVSHDASHLFAADDTSLIFILNSL